MNEPDRRHAFDGFDADAIFADIVAHLNDVAAEPERAAGPSAEDVATPDAATDDGAAHDGPADQPSAAHDHPPSVQPPWLPAPDHPQATPTPQVWRAYDVDEEYEEHFEPPPVAPLPAGDLQFWAILAGMGGGPLLLLYLILFNRNASSYWTLTAFVMSVGGFALLVARLPRDREDGDDGARL